MILRETLRQLQPWMALVEKLGRLYTQLHPGPLHRAELDVAGEIAQYDTRPPTAALIKGLLESVSEAHVNLVNAPILARDWGLEITESRRTTHEQYANLVTLRVRDGESGSGVTGGGGGRRAPARHPGEGGGVRGEPHPPPFAPPRPHPLFRQLR